MSRARLFFQRRPSSESEQVIAFPEQSDRIPSVQQFRKVSDIAGESKASQLLVQPMQWEAHGGHMSRRRLSDEQPMSTPNLPAVL